MGRHNRVGCRRCDAPPRLNLDALRLKQGLQALQVGVAKACCLDLDNQIHDAQRVHEAGRFRHRLRGRVHGDELGKVPTQTERRHLRRAPWASLMSACFKSLWRYWVFVHRLCGGCLLLGLD